MGQHQILHGKFHIDHAARAVFDVKQIRLHRVSCAHLVAHGYDLLLQSSHVTLGIDDAGAHGIEPRFEFRCT